MAMNKKYAPKIVPALGLVASLMVSPVASAEVYVGLGIGQADEAIAYDESTTSFSLALGYYFSEYFAVEGEYISLGSLNDGAGDIHLGGIAGLFVVNLPLAETVDVFAKMGFYSWDVTYTEEGHHYYYQEDLNSDTNLMYSMGVNFAVAERLDAVFEYQQIDFDYSEKSVPNITLGIRYYF